MQNLNFTEREREREREIVCERERQREREIVSALSFTGFLQLKERKGGFSTFFHPLSLFLS